MESFCAQNGKFSTGKNVPLKRNMGVMNRNIGKLNISMVGTIPVKNMPMDPKAKYHPGKPEVWLKDPEDMKLGRTG